jgi:hypothetical protein
VNRTDIMRVAAGDDAAYLDQRIDRDSLLEASTWRSTGRAHRDAGMPPDDHPDRRDGQDSAGDHAAHAGAADIPDYRKEA